MEGSSLSVVLYVIFSLVAALCLINWLDWLIHSKNRGRQKDTFERLKGDLVDDSEYIMPKTCDMEYAARNNMWVCRFCETLNQRYSDKCVACGKSKYK